MSYSTLMLVSEKVPKSVERESTARSVRLQRNTACIQSSSEIGFVGCHRNDVETWEFWLAAATDSPHEASSEYRLARLTADMTLSVH